MVRVLPWREAPWSVGLEAQRAEAGRVRAGADDAVLLFSHPPTVTLGRAAVPSDVPDTAGLRARGVAVLRSDRGGRATWHGPGQVVGYPVVNLRRRGLSPADLVSRVLGALAGWLAGLGLTAEPSLDPAGVWAGGRKVASLGMRLAGGVTTHGFAVNLAVPEDAFAGISPCGLDPAEMASVADLAAAPSTEPAAGAIGAAVAGAL